MKSIVKFLSVILIGACITLLTLNFVSKKIILNTVANVYTNNRVVSNVLSQVRTIIDIDTDTVHKLNKEFYQSKEIDKIAEIYLESIIKDLTSSEEVNSKVDINENCRNLIKNSKYLDSNQKEKVLKEIKDINYDFIYELGIRMLKDKVTPNTIKYLKIYTTLDNFIFKIVVWTLLVILLLVTFVRNKIGNAFKLCTISMTLSTIAVIVTNIVLKNNLNKAVATFTSYSINYSLITIVDIVFVVVTFVLLVITLVSNRKQSRA